MAEAGRDLILRVLDEVGRLRSDVDSLRSEMRERFSTQGDSLLLVAATVQRLTTTVKDRIDEHDRRITAVERER